MEDYAKYDQIQLVSLLKEGDDRAFSEIYSRYFEVLLFHAFQMLKNRDAAQDVVQEVFTILWEKHQDLDIHTSLSAYLYVTVRHAVLKVIRRSKMADKFLENMSVAASNRLVYQDPDVRDYELRKLIEKEVHLLPPKMREVFYLSRQEDRSHREIAKMLHLSENTVSRQISNALSILRKRLARWIFLSLLISSLCFFLF